MQQLVLFETPNEGQIQTQLLFKVMQKSKCLTVISSAKCLEKSIKGGEEQAPLGSHHVALLLRSSQKPILHLSTLTQALNFSGKKRQEAIVDSI